MKLGYLMAVLSLSLVLNIQANATSIGTPLALQSVAGSPSFGATYSYGDDSDGSSYLLHYGTVSNDTRLFRWNFYLASTDTYLLPWINNAISPVIGQMKIQDATLVAQLLSGQKMVNGKANLFLIFADANNLPVYNISISEVCASAPDAFKNLTDDKACNQF